MRIKASFGLVVLGLWAVLGSAAQTQVVPSAVSPGSERGLAVVGLTCPTFSWTAVDWALGYRVAVFQAFGTGGAYCNGGAWVDGSSREYKENIETLTSEEALAAFQELAPVKFNYKTNKEEKYLGFIAEDVPELVAMKDRKGLSPMDVVAVLTKVVQEQQKTISDYRRAMSEQQKTISELAKRVGKLEKKGKAGK